jgi:hypothetical protein
MLQLLPARQQREDVLGQQQLASTAMSASGITLILAAMVGGDRRVQAT